MYTYNGEDYNRETGLQYLRARWYDTNRAVFLSEDSYLGDLLQPLTRNRYLYVCNNPLNFIDPSGHINWSRQLKYLTATVLGLAVGAAALAAFPATIAVGVGAAAVTFLMVKRSLPERVVYRRSRMQGVRKRLGRYRRMRMWRILI